MTTTNLTSTDDRAFTIEGVTVTASDLANTFIGTLRAEIGEDDFREACRLNATPKYTTGCCASHDFCDANMTMLDSCMSFGLSDDDLDALTDLMNVAWNIAHKRMAEGGRLAG